MVMLFFKQLLNGGRLILFIEEDDRTFYNPMTFGCLQESDAFYTVNNEEGNANIKFMNCFQDS